MRKGLVLLAAVGLALLVGCGGSPTAAPTERPLSISSPETPSPSQSPTVSSPAAVATPSPTVETADEPTSEPPPAEPEPEAEPSGDCHPSYDPCLPIVSDVDCEGGSGNGPVYTGKVRVIGPDEYDLDRDNDGWGCED